MDLLRREVPATSLVVAVDPDKAFNRVWLTTGERGLIGEPVTLPVLRDGVDELERLIAASGVGGPPVIGLEATGSLHRAWAAEIERRWPGSLRLFAPSETTATSSAVSARELSRQLHNEHGARFQAEQDPERERSAISHALAGTVVLVTGASSGRGLAEALAQVPSQRG